MKPSSDNIMITVISMNMKLYNCPQHIICIIDFSNKKSMIKFCTTNKDVLCFFYVDNVLCCMDVAMILYCVESM